MSDYHNSQDTKTCSVPLELLITLVEPFKPEEIGAAQAWEEFYMACQAAGASHKLLRAIHDIMESLEELEEKHYAGLH